MSDQRDLVLRWIERGGVVRIWVLLLAGVLLCLAFALGLGWLLG